MDNVASKAFVRYCVSQAGLVGEKGNKGDKGDQGIQGIQGLPGADGADGYTHPDAASYEPLTNGDSESPEILFYDGDVIMAEV